MHSLIAAGRFVQIGGVFYAKPIHADDPGPVTLLRKKDEGFCSSSLRAGRSQMAGARMDPDHLSSAA